MRIYPHTCDAYEVRACGYVGTPYASCPVQEFGSRYYGANSRISVIAK